MKRRSRPESRFAAAFNAKDVEAIMKAYAPDKSLVVFDVVPPRQYVGADAYRKDFEGFLGLFKGSPKFEITGLSVTADGSLGYGHSIQHIVGTSTKDQPIDLTVRVTDVYRKINGKWLIVQSMSRCQSISTPASRTCHQNRSSVRRGQPEDPLLRSHLPLKPAFIHTLPTHGSIYPRYKPLICSASDRRSVWLRS